MKREEKNERMDVMEGEKRIGCVSVRYPFFHGEYQRINGFYERLASSYIRFAEKKIPKMKKKIGFEGMINFVFFCKVTYSDEKYLSIRCEARIYMENERSYTKCFSNVWSLPKCRLAYKRCLGIRRCNIQYNGKEFY
ncbi:MAG: hypothetical protein E7652_08620 [Ruminococcaceae bacterium]|nr:hypothetical protein [Oscillospiraceae bacterium]